ncbi:MAG TPA: rRNA maturation RNase YbeY [Puia sp.]|nr:rRNA maturation RNase YbeY [Puia sp.]
MPSPQISFHSLVPVTALKDRKRFKSFLSRLFVLEKTRLNSLAIIFSDDNDLLSINKEWLHHDYLTDTISFLLSEPEDPVLGEIYISIDRVKDNARTFQTTIREELHRVIIHSCLHLCGYDDTTKDLKEKMRKLENKWLARYF